MIRHIVLFSIKGGEGLDSIGQANRLKELLLTLPEKVSYLKHMEVGVNSDRAPVDNAQLSLMCDFDSIEDCAFYQIHPEHVKVSNEISKFRISRMCVDYEI